MLQDILHSQLPWYFATGLLLGLLLLFARVQRWRSSPVSRVTALCLHSHPCAFSSQINSTMRRPLSVGLVNNLPFSVEYHSSPIVGDSFKLDMNAIQTRYSESLWLQDGHSLQTEDNCWR